MILSAKGKDKLSILEKKIIKSALLSGEIIAFPTDTVYGIGVNGYIYDAVAKIYKIKDREKEKPLILFLPSIDKAKDFIENTELLNNEIIKKYWPGPLTVIFRKKSDLKLYFSQVQVQKIGIRIPDYPLILDLLSFLDFPLVTTSANISGNQPLKSGLEIEKKLNRGENNVSIIIDNGELEINTPSTVVSIENDGVKVLREGIIKIK